MATLRDIYNDLKKGYGFQHASEYIKIGTDDRWNSPSYGKEYIYWSHAGSSAENVSFRDFCWLVHDIFKIRDAKEFLEYFERY